MRTAPGRDDVDDALVEEATDNGLPFIHGRGPYSAPAQGIVDPVVEHTDAANATASKPAIKDARQRR